MKKKKNLEKTDKEAWESFTKNPQNIFDKEINGQKTQNKHQFKFDLHGYSLVSANNKVREIVDKCIEKKYSEILLITGKGIHSNTDNDVFISKDLSKLRYSIPEYINSNTDLSKKILDIKPATKKDGGDGALVLKLNNK